MAKIAQKKFETQLARLEAVVDELEQGDISLEKSVALYKEGLTLVKACRGQLVEARHMVEVFTQDLATPLNLDSDGNSEGDDEHGFED